MKITWLPIFICVAVAGGNAQDQFAVLRKPPPIPLQVLESQEIDLGNRSLIYNRVAPPVLAEPPPPPPPREPTYSAEELAIIERRANKSFGVLFVSATVYDRKVSELRWSGTGRNEIHAFSNIDFNLMSGVMEIETDDAVYMIMMGLGNETTESVSLWNSYVDEEGLPPSLKRHIPGVTDFPAGKTTYVVVPEKPRIAEQDPSDELTKPISRRSLREEPEVESQIDPYVAMDALLAYYDAHRAELARDYEAREAANRAREKWLKEHPPVPKDTVINLWPQRNSVYLESGN